MPDGFTIPLGHQIVSKRYDLADLRRRIGEEMAKETRDNGAVDKLLDEIEKTARELSSLEAKEREAMRSARPITGEHPAPAILRQLGDLQVTPEHVVRSALVAIEAHIARRRVDEVMIERYGDDRVLASIIQATNPVTKAAQNPAMTSVATYAAELVRQTYGAWLSLLKDAGAVAQVPWLSADFSTGDVVFPMRKSPADPFPDNFEAAFRKEGDPVRIGKLSLVAAPMKPYSAGVIGHFTKELFRRSTPNIELVIREAIVSDSAAMLDSIVFGSAAGTDLRPPGLTNALPASATRASTGADLAAVELDLNGLVAALMRARVGVRPTWIMNGVNRLALDSLMTDLGVFPYRADVRRGVLKGYPIASSVFVAEDQILLVDAANIGFVGGAPEWEVSDQATLHEETETPLQVGGATTPVRSLFQTHSAAVKAVYELSWLKLRDAAVQQLTAINWLPLPP